MAGNTSDCASRDSGVPLPQLQRGRDTKALKLNTSAAYLLRHRASPLARAQQAPKIPIHHTTKPASRRSAQLCTKLDHPGK